MFIPLLAQSFASHSTSHLVIHFICKKMHIFTEIKSYYFI